MLLVAPYYFSPSPRLFNCIHNSNKNNNRKKFRSLLSVPKSPTRFCVASLITNSDSFEVGRLIGSYGFMNVTSYSGYQPGMDIEFSPGYLGQLKIQDVGEGSVKISCFAGFTKEE